MTEPTIDEQKAWIYERKRECSYNGWSESVRMCDAIDASLERLKSLDALAVPVEPEYLIRLRNALKGFKSDGAFAGDKDIVDYIDSLQSALKRAQEARQTAVDLWSNTGETQQKADDTLRKISSVIGQGGMWDTENLDYDEVYTRIADGINAHLNIQSERAEKAKALAEQFRKDAERYQWLVDKVMACDYGDNDKGRVGWIIGHCKGPKWIEGLSIDAAIDSARAE